MNLPLCIPTRNSILWSGLCGTLKSRFTPSIRWRAMPAISAAWLWPFLIGRPDTTIYASPIVSTYKNRVQLIVWHGSTQTCKMTGKMNHWSNKTLKQSFDLRTNSQFACLFFVVGMSSLIFWLQARQLRLSVYFNTFRNFNMSLNKRRMSLAQTITEWTAGKCLDKRVQSKQTPNTS